MLDGVADALQAAYLRTRPASAAIARAPDAQSLHAAARPPAAASTAGPGTRPDGIDESAASRGAGAAGGGGPGGPAAGQTRVPMVRRGTGARAAVERHGGLQRYCAGHAAAVRYEKGGQAQAGKLNAAVPAGSDNTDRQQTVRRCRLRRCSGE